MKKKISIKESELDLFVKQVIKENEDLESEFEGKSDDLMLNLVEDKMGEVEMFIEETLKDLMSEGVRDKIKDMNENVVIPLTRELEKLNEDGSFDNDLEYLYEVDSWMDETWNLISELENYKTNLKPRR